MVAHKRVQSSGNQRWMGKVDSDIKNLQDDTTNLGSDLKKLDANNRLLELKVEKIATKIGVFASLGAILGGGVVSLIIGIFFKH